MKKTLKKSLALVLTVLMLMTSLPFAVINSSAATVTIDKTLTRNAYGVIRGGDTTRLSGDVFTICNDSQADNTSAGIIRYDISELEGSTVTSATLNAVIDSYNTEGRDTAFYWSTGNNCGFYVGNNSYKVSLSTGGWYTGVNSILDVLGIPYTKDTSYHDAPVSTQLIGKITTGSTNVNPFDITGALNNAVQAGNKYFFVVVEKAEAGSSGSDGGWTDTAVTASKQTISVTAEQKVTTNDAQGKLEKLNDYRYNPPSGEYASFAGDNTADFQEGTNYNTYMKNVLWGEKSTTHEDDSSSGDRHAYLKYPQAAFLYDGMTNLDSPVILQLVHTTKGDHWVRRGYTDVDGLTLARSYWNGRDYADNWAWLYSKDVIANDKNVKAFNVYEDSTNTKISQGGLVGGWWNEYYRFANMFRFNGSFGANEYVKKIYPKVVTKWDTDVYIFTYGSNPLYYVNYKAILDRVDSAKSVVQNLVQDEWMYTDASLNAYYNAIDSLVGFKYNSYSFGSNIENEVNALGNGIKSVCDTYDNALAGLTKKQFTATYVAANGSIVEARTITAGNPLGENPANTAPSYNGNKKHIVYEWTSLIPADSTYYNNGAVVPTQLITKDVTINEYASADPVDCSFNVEHTKLPSCSETGLDTFTCAICGGSYTAEVKKESHIKGTATIENNVAATCTSPEKYDEVYYCTVCTNEISRTTVEVGDPLEHDWVEKTVITAATCTKNGSSVFECSLCYAEETRETPLADHTPEVIPAKTATCQHAGSTEGSECSVCGTILVNPENIPLVAHKYGEFVYNNDATCGEDGTETATCIYAYDGCQLSKSRKAVGSSASVEHVWGEGVVTTPATCSTKGVMTFTCENCTNTKTAEIEIDSDNHDSWTIQTAKKEATCGKDGAEAIYVCGCGDATKGGETIPATGNHELRLVANRIDAKCNAEGKTAVYGCKNCDYTEGGETIPFAEHKYKNVVTPPTCTVPGYTTKICTFCGANGGIIPGSETTKEHNYTVVVDPEDPATCSTTGKTAVMKCSDCDAITGGETIEIVADAHVLETVAAQASTCTVKGWNEYKKCTLCDYNTKVELALAAHDYEVTTPEKPATCSATGITAIKTCKNCDATIGGDEIDVIPNAHVLETVEAQASTCTVRGWKEYKQCTLCDYNTKVLLPLAEHNYEETAPEFPATCVDPGTTAVEACTECGNTIGGQVIPATGKHSFTVPVTPEVPATCTEPGTKAVMKCATCDETSGGTSITRLGHDIINHDGKEPTCTEPGNTAYKTCSRCDYTNYGEIPARGHDFKNVVAEKVGATCGADGSTVVMGCTRCDATTGGDVIPATGEHINSIILKAEVPANCVTDGATAKVQCEVCNTITESTVISATGVHTFTVEVSPMVRATCVDNGKTAVMKCANCEATSGGEVITANGEHDFSVLVSAKVEATCAADGKTAVYKCANCDETTGGEKINALAHDLVSVTAKAPTCKGDGYNTHVYCKNCDYTTKVIRPATGAHKFTVLVAKEVKATCTEDGTTAIYKCSVCGTTNGGEKIDALTHDLIDIEAQAPTCCEEGWNAYQECSRCDYTTFESISATGIHSYTVLVSAKLDATCEEDGAEAVYKCATCDATIGGDVIPATGHNDGDKNGLCDECGSPVDCDHTNTTLTGAKDPDCVRKGYTGDKVCDECGTIVEKGKYIPALGHTVVKDPAVKATCLEGGLTEGSHCSVCGIILEGQLPTAKGNHTKAVKPGKEATCSEYGYTEEIYCSVCDKVLERSQPTEKLNHKDENHDGNCDECGVSISAACNCICHKKSWISRLIYKILRFFWKLFKIGHSCACGTVHY